MSRLSISGIFCEDIREEKGGVLTLVGLMPDNVNMTVADDKSSDSDAALESKMLSKLCVFVRANFPPDEQLKTIELSIVMPNSVEIPVGGAKEDVVEVARSQARDMGLPLAGVVMRAVLGGFKLPKPGILSLKATVDGRELLLAMINFRIVGETTSPTA